MDAASFVLSSFLCIFHESMFTFETPPTFHDQFANDSSFLVLHSPLNILFFYTHIDFSHFFCFSLL